MVSLQIKATLSCLPCLCKAPHQDCFPGHWKALQKTAETSCFCGICKPSQIKFRTLMKKPWWSKQHPVDPTSSKPSHLTRTPTTTDSSAAIIDCENFHGALIPIMILNMAYVCACSMVCILCIYYAKKNKVDWVKIAENECSLQRWSKVHITEILSFWCILADSALFYKLDYWAGLFVIWATSYKFSRLLNRGNDTKQKISFSFWVISTTNLSTITCLCKKTLKVNINVDRFWGWKSSRHKLHGTNSPNI